MPINKGVRDYNRPDKYVVTTATKTNETTTITSKCSDTFSDIYGVYTTSKECTGLSTSTIPSYTFTTLIPTTASETDTSPTTARTYPTATTTDTWQETAPQWRDIENSRDLSVEQAIPWHPLGVCGLAKWYMADKGHPAWGVKKKIHIYDDDATDEYQGALEENGLLESGIKTDTYKNYFSEGLLDDSISAISNVQKIYQGLEGFIRGAFLWRYNLHHPWDKGYTPLFSEIQDKWTHEVDGVIYPTDWIRVKVQGVKLNEEGKVIEVALVTKYGTGSNPVWGIRENTKDGDFWTNSTSLLREPACTKGYEGHVALVPLSILFEFSDEKIFYFTDDPKKNDINYFNVLADIPSNVANDWSYPLTLEENALTEDQIKILEFAELDKQDGVSNIIKDLDVPEIAPQEPLYNVDDAKNELKKSILKKQESISFFPVPNVSDPVGNSNTPQSSEDFLFWEYYPNIWRLNTNTPDYSSLNYPYHKSWLIDGVEVDPEFRITSFKRYSDKQNKNLKGFNYLQTSVDDKTDYTWIAHKEYTWKFEQFGETSFTWLLGHPKLIYLHDVQVAVLQAQRTFNFEDETWELKAISDNDHKTKDLIFSFPSKVYNQGLKIQNLSNVFGYHFDLENNLKDQALIKRNTGKESSDAIFLFEFPQFNNVHT